MKKSLEKWYIDFVRKAAKKEENIDIDNSSVDHAVLVIEELIRYASKNIYILTDEFKDKFYRLLDTTLINFLKKGGKIYILSYNDISNNEFLKDLKNRFPKNIFVKKVLKEDKPKLFVEKQQKYINFILNDKKGVRYELDEKLNDLTTRAIVNYGDEETHDLFKQVFDKYFERGEEVKFDKS
ncbi:hypothetical protein [Persephonella sp.]|uniref:hypothetical protein n=1 Tax=Persephonella sp. TaxID=2060922 RepID=UPI0026121D91|nr:hypothetical protein [Persephonella sp.]